MTSGGASSRAKKVCVAWFFLILLHPGLRTAEQREGQPASLAEARQRGDQAAGPASSCTSTAGSPFESDPVAVGADTAHFYCNSSGFAFVGIPAGPAFAGQQGDQLPSMSPVWERAAPPAASPVAGVDLGAGGPPAASPRWFSAMFIHIDRLAL